MDEKNNWSEINNNISEIKDKIKNSINEDNLTSDLKDSLDKEDNNSNNKEEDNVELSEKEERLARDYQLRRALDLIRGLSLFEESLEE